MEKQNSRPTLWLAEAFSTSSRKLLNGNQQNWTGSKTSKSSTKFVFFGLMNKTRWLPWPLIGWGIFDFSSETTERNATKLDRKQGLNVFYQVCVLRADRKNKKVAWPLIGWDIFDFFLKPLNGIQRNLTGSKISKSSTKFVFFFRADGRNKMAAMASDWLRHFRLLLWNRWTEFNETWQEARPQRPLPSLCFSGRWEKTKWPPLPLIGWYIFDFFFGTA